MTFQNINIYKCFYKDFAFLEFSQKKPRQTVPAIQKYTTSNLTVIWQTLLNPENANKDKLFPNIWVKDSRLTDANNTQIIHYVHKQ